MAARELNVVQAHNVSIVLHCPLLHNFLESLWIEGNPIVGHRISTYIAVSINNYDLFCNVVFIMCFELVAKTKLIIAHKGSK